MTMINKWWTFLSRGGSSSSKESSKGGGGGIIASLWSNRQTPDILQIVFMKKLTIDPFDAQKPNQITLQTQK